MVMEHFEVHKEQLEDLIIDVDKFGPRIWADIPDGRERQEIVTLDDFALIDELSGLNQFLENFMLCHDIPETVKDRIRSRMITYSGAKSKDVAMQELRIKVFGTGYWAQNSLSNWMKTWGKESRSVEVRGCAKKSGKPKDLNLMPKSLIQSSYLSNNWSNNKIRIKL